MAKEWYFIAFSGFYLYRGVAEGASGGHEKGGEDMSGMYRNRVKLPFGKWKLSIQRSVQLAAALLFNGYLIGFQKGQIYTGGSKAICVPVLNCYSCPGALGACPIGALQNALGARQRYVPFYVLGMLMLFGVLLGRLVCGFLCPFGLVQDLLYQLHRLLVWRFLNRIKIRKSTGKKLDSYARYLKYGILLVFVILLPAFVSVKAGVRPPWFCQYICPAGTLEGGVWGLLKRPELRAAAGLLWNWKLFVLLVICIASIVIHRPFCRYLCPLGAFYALFQRFSFFQMHLDTSRCTGCRACERVCPMEVEVTKHINSPECIRCGACKTVCPTKAISAGLKEKQKSHL